MAVLSFLLRSLTSSLYGIEFCCSIIILGIYGYFLGVLAKNQFPIAPWVRAVEGMAGAIALYLLLATLLTLFVGAHQFFAILASLFNIAMIGGFLAIAALTRHGATSCKGPVNTPLGEAISSSDAPGVGNYRYVCQLNKVCFAVSVIGAGLLIFTILSQLLLSWNHRRERRHTAAAAAAATAPLSSVGEKGKFGGKWANNRFTKLLNSRGKSTGKNDAADAEALGNSSGATGGSGGNPYGYENKMSTTGF